MIKTAKSHHIQETFDRLTDQLLSLGDWGKLVKTLFCNNSRSIPTLKVTQGASIRYVDDNKQKADVLNDFFVKTTDMNDKGRVFPDLAARTDQIMESINVMEADVLDIIKTLSFGKSSGPDNIPNYILKQVAIAISKPLTKFFNLSLRNRKFPKQWKIAYITALYKRVSIRPVKLQTSSFNKSLS